MMARTVPTRWVMLLNRSPGYIVRNVARRRMRRRTPNSFDAVELLIDDAPVASDLLQRHHSFDLSSVVVWSGDVDLRAIALYQSAGHGCGRFRIVQRQILKV